MHFCALGAESQKKTEGEQLAFMVGVVCGSFGILGINLILFFLAIHQGSITLLR